MTRVRTYLPLGLIPARSWVAPILLLGCASAPFPEHATEPLEPNSPIAVSPEFLPEERAEIDNAVQQVFDATGGSVRFQFVTLDSPAPWRIERAQIADCDGTPAAGCCRHGEKLIEIDAESIYPVELLSQGFDLQHWGYFRVVTLHELVHALRPDLPHGSVPILTGDGYMDQRPCLTAEDVAAICAGRGCAEQRPTCG